MKTTLIRVLLLLLTVTLLLPLTACGNVGKAPQEDNTTVGSTDALTESSTREATEPDSFTTPTPEETITPSEETTTAPEETTAPPEEDAQPTDQERNEASRMMDMIVWYDVDHGKSTNSRPDNGWYYLYADTPGLVTGSGHFRAANPLLGTYDQADPAVARQHLYWLAASGINAVLCDLTNYDTIQNDDPGSDMRRFHAGLLNNTKVVFETAKAMKAEGMENVPTVCVAVRMNGNNTENLQKVLDEIYDLCKDYPDEVYHLNGGDKPFICIFVDHTVLQNMQKNNAVFDDERFDIRWSNGSFGNYFATEKNGNNIVVGYEKKVFLFWDPVKNPGREGFYRSFYTIGKDGEPEMMTGWVSFFGGWSSDDTNWDALNHTYEGLNCFERTTANVDEVMPSALLVCRFNYALCWKEQPQEGLGLYHSGHFEPCEELGFSVFHDVTRRLYVLNKWVGKAPAAPTVVDATNNHLFLDTATYPLEYLLSSNESFEGAEWQYININEGIDYTDYVAGGEVWIKTRNTFGESDAVKLTLENTSDASRVEASILVDEDFLD